RIRGILSFARQREAEDAALSFGALDFHAPPVSFGDVTNHGQADSGPWNAALANGFAADELLEEPGLLVARDPVAVIYHANGHSRAIGSGFDPHVAAVARVLHRIVKKVPDGTAERLAV